MTRTARASLFTTAIVILCALAIGPAIDARSASTNGAQTDARWDRFAGEWRAESDGAPLVNAAIEQATSDMNMFTRGTARRRLRERNAAPASIRMSRAGDMFTIHFADGEPVALPISSTPVQVGDRTIRIEPEPGGEGLRHVGETADGARENVFRLDGADRLTMTVTATSPRLPAPVKYTLGFTR